MSDKKNSKVVYIIAFLLIFSGVGYLMVTSLSQNSTYFLEVSKPWPWILIAWREPGFLVQWARAIW
ncbi:MAG: hypothetical protein ACLFT1_00970 [Desulfonatronovibrio sp.]